MVDETIGERIKKIIDTLGITKTSFAKKMKISQPYVSQLISGDRLPSERLLEYICQKFDVNELWLRTGNGDMFNETPENDIVAKSAILLGERDPLFEAFVEVYGKLTNTNREVLLEFGLKYLEELKKRVDEKES
ncbi:helix-turn-helix domain-containing protein [Velocimicrobium porci]|uniref:Helix-turn-helix domain-containing protein n=1 Tax=Velocimicrobium porci TaxID=2606634 RepID=A0A6L5XX11_9FIRM|nr:helix-turn-helix domain-containing protein [Velocimicrobium porci]MSS63154.1 helix-turn-helix domain-containing protein [Velocimicrobium porci]